MHMVKEWIKNEMWFCCSESDGTGGWGFRAKRACGPTGCYSLGDIFKIEKTSTHTECGYGIDQSGNVTSGCSTAGHYTVYRRK